MGPLSNFPYRGGQLTVEGLPLRQIAEAVGTPFYCYSQAAVERQFEGFAGAFAGVPSMICFAMKANSNQAILRMLARLGAGMDVVSEGELRRARAADVPGERITFSGVGKTAAEIALALDENIFCFNVESEPELSLISEVATAKGRVAPIALRVNPDVDARTHSKISTGLYANKFGIPMSRAVEVYATAARLPGVNACGVDMHIGSQITELDPFKTAFGLLRSLVKTLLAAGHRIEHLDLGGGLGVPYREDEDPASYHPDRYASVVLDELGTLKLKLVFEPGRLIVANAGALVTKAIYVKRGEGKNFLIVDAGMNDLIRPTLYDAHHEIVPLAEAAASQPQEIYDVVGPICETGDYLALERRLPSVNSGGLLAILSAGAYGAVQAGTYNSRLLAPEVLVSDGRWSIVRPRQTYSDLIGQDKIPVWLE